MLLPAFVSSMSSTLSSSFAWTKSTGESKNFFASWLGSWGITVFNPKEYQQSGAAITKLSIFWLRKIRMLWFEKNKLFC